MSGNLPAPQCWCCAFYGLLRPGTQPGGVCVMCALLPQLCERGHQMAARYELNGSESHA